MVSSNYPRQGEAIAPQLLHELLWHSVPASFKLGNTRLWQLDRRIWDETDSKQAAGLAKLVIDRVSFRMNTMPQTTLSKILPELPAIVLSELNVEVRTRGCLARMARQYQVKTLADLSGLSIKHLLAVRGLGARCLVDLLTALEARQINRQPGDGISSLPTQSLSSMERLNGADAATPIESSRMGENLHSHGIFHIDYCHHRCLQ